MKLEEAQKIAEEIKGWLEPYCEPGRCVIAGSIRRRRPEVNDVELLCIPLPIDPLVKKTYRVDDHQCLDRVDIVLQCLIKANGLKYRLNAKGSKTYGPQNKLLTHVASGMPVDIFSTDEECWATAMVVRTGPKASNIRIAIAAKNKGWRFNAYGSGFTRGDDSKIICRTEREVFEAVDYKYFEPWERR